MAQRTATRPAGAGAGAAAAGCSAAPRLPHAGALAADRPGRRGLRAQHRRRHPLDRARHRLARPARRQHPRRRAVIVRELRVPRTAARPARRAGARRRRRADAGPHPQPARRPGPARRHRRRLVRGRARASGCCGVDQPAGYVWFAFAGALLASVAVFADRLGRPRRGHPGQPRARRRRAERPALRAGPARSLIRDDARPGRLPVLGGRLARRPGLRRRRRQVAAVPRRRPGARAGQRPGAEPARPRRGRRPRRSASASGWPAPSASLRSRCSPAPPPPPAVRSPSSGWSSRTSPARVTGPDHRWLIPYSGLLGAVLLLLADVIGRVVARPGELQVGIVLALIGAPFFIALVRRRKLVCAVTAVAPAARPRPGPARGAPCGSAGCRPPAAVRQLVVPLLVLAVLVLLSAVSLGRGDFPISVARRAARRSSGWATTASGSSSASCAPRGSPSPCWSASRSASPARSSRPSPATRWPARTSSASPAAPRVGAVAVIVPRRVGAAAGSAAGLPARGAGRRRCSSARWSSCWPGARGIDGYRLVLVGIGLSAMAAAGRPVLAARPAATSRTPPAPTSGSPARSTAAAGTTAVPLALALLVLRARWRWRCSRVARRRCSSATTPRRGLGVRVQLAQAAVVLVAVGAGRRRGRRGRADRVRRPRRPADRRPPDRRLARRRCSPSGLLGALLVVGRRPGRPDACCPSTCPSASSPPSSAPRTCSGSWSAEGGRATL